MVTGHFRFTRGSYHDRSRLYITFLRDPLDRILSAYYYYRSRPDDVQAEQVLLAKQYTFEEFIDLPNPSVRILIDNHQTFSFGLADPRTHGLTGANVFRAAVEVLESYDFVGVHEYFALSVTAMCRQMGWSAVKRIPRLNKTVERAKVEDLSRETKDKLLSLNGMDHELYQYFIKKFASWCPIETPSDTTAEPGISSPSTPYSMSTAGNSRRMGSFPPGGLGSREIEILSVSLQGERSTSGAVMAGEWACLAISLQSRISSENVNISLSVWDEIGQLAFACRGGEATGFHSVVPGGIYTATFRLKMNLGMGLYTIDAVVHSGSDYQEHCYHYLANAAQIEVEGSEAGWFGGHTWLETESSVAQVGPIDHALAAIELVSKPARFRAGSTAKFHVKVTNQGSTAWPSSGQMLICCCYHILDAQGESVIWDGLRSMLPGDVAPGESARVDVQVILPEKSGSYVVRLTLLQEGAAWFDDQGANPVDVPVEVRAASAAHRAAVKV